MNNLISVIMPAYNAELFIGEAIESILNQTFTNYEFIIINDGSNDSTEKIIKRYKDTRIKYIKNKINLGLSETLNRGIDLATGNYIARMDADDISFPDRLTKQVTFLSNNPDYGVVGCMYIVLDEKRKPFEIGGMDYRTDEEIKLALFSNNVFLHGETMFRRELLENILNPYNTKYNPCEDYKLWIILSKKTKFYILEDILYQYMINPNSMSGTRWFEMKEMIKKIGKEWQSVNGLPTITHQMFVTFFKAGKRKKDGLKLFNQKVLPFYNQLNYQEFLFRTGLVYVKHIRAESLGLLIVSFLINPINWFKKFYRLIFITHPRLKKISK